MARPMLSGRPLASEDHVLGVLLRPCGPVVDASAAARSYEALCAVAEPQGWVGALDGAWAALAPIFAASPYLANLARRAPERLHAALETKLDVSLQTIVAATAALAGAELDVARRELRRLKSDVHLLIALADLGGVWGLDRVTEALTGFADAAVQSALAVVAHDARSRGKLSLSDPALGPVPGLFCLALGKHGACELNYSSDIDICVFYAPAVLASASTDEAQGLALASTQKLAALLQERTADGYVFRVDLRLRPDPAATPLAMPAPAALIYYETAGQNWERAAMIKARPCAGDLAEAERFLAELRPFIWRRTLDYAAIADIQAIKRQIHVHKVDERLSAPGHNLKLGAGGIREIEFFVQTQQLILGGRDARLRAPRTLDALAALADAGHVAPEAAQALSADYRQLRDLEHRVQMIADEQTHILPMADAARSVVAALAGYDDLAAFDAQVSHLLHRVNARYGELFAQDEGLSSPFGSLVFTGVDDDPETLQTLARMGFANPAQVSAQIRNWHYGRIPATRSERGRELFTRLAPRLLEAARRTGSPDTAFNRFADFFSRLSSGVQIQSLFLAQRELFTMVVEILAFAPSVAATLSRQPGSLDSLLDAHFFDRVQPAEMTTALRRAVGGAGDFEAAIGAARRAHREQAFRIGVQVITGAIDAEQAGQAFAALADACVVELARISLAETERLGGAFAGEAAVVALGKTGSREMNAQSDLDLMTLYTASSDTAASALRGWGAETFYTRFTQRLITALSAPTADGDLYKVDLQLRPSGRAGPVAVSLSTFRHYYQADAETWEAMALTRGRVVWASTPAFAEEAGAAIQAALRQPRDAARTARDAADMRALMARERPARGLWDLKLAPGGLVDIEFAAQVLQLIHAAGGGPLDANTGRALADLMTAQLVDDADLHALLHGWRLQQDLTQILKIALLDDGDPVHEPERFQALLALAGNHTDFVELQAALVDAQAAAHQALLTCLSRF